MNASYLKFRMWCRRSLFGHIVAFGVIGGILASIAFSILFYSEGTLNMRMVVNLFSTCVGLFSIIGILFWYTMTLPAIKRKQKGKPSGPN